MTELPGHIATESVSTGDEAKIAIVTEIRSTLEVVQDLPTFPSIAYQAMSVAADPGGSLTRLVELIEVDAVLTAKILRTANSAYFGVPRKVGNLKTALVVIGMEEIGKLVATATVLNMFPSYSDASSFGKRFWFHNAAVAELTIGLYNSLSLPKPFSAYVTSLLHDIGRLILFEHFRRYHTMIETEKEREKCFTHVAEMKVIGIDHGHIGAWLLERWNLPEEIITAVAQHHIRPEAIPRYCMPVVIDHADQLFYIIEETDAMELTNYLWVSEYWRNWLNIKQMNIAKLSDDLFRRFERAERLLMMLK